MLRPSGAAALARLRHGRGGSPWRLRCLPVCASTERELSDWLADDPWQGVTARAVLAERQRAGHGQWGRVWTSPAGGVWLSAALPWPAQGCAPALLGLAVAAALAERLRRAGLPVRIKWPNDLLVHGCKLAGILPRMVHRGASVRLARVGVGLNVVNTVPPGAIAIADCLPAAQRSPQPLVWAAEVLEALDAAVVMAAEPSRVCAATEALLWAREVRSPDTGEAWSIQGLAEDGALLLANGASTMRWTRWADAPGSAP